MSEFFKGVVLDGVKSATSNAETTNEAEAKVVRDFAHKDELFSNFSQAFRDTLPEYVDLRADFYRSHHLAEETSEEYFIWSANGSNLALDEQKVLTNATAFFVDKGLRIRDGLPDTYFDATDTFKIKDNTSLTIDEIVSLTINIQGDEAVLLPAHFDFNVPTGTLTIKNTNDTRVLTKSGANQAALSPSRGDKITHIEYRAQSARFWWTKNDTSTDLFKWDGSKGNWALIKGTAPLNLDKLTSPNLTLPTPPTWVQVGEFLDGGESDQYATLRLGDTPNESATPIAPNQDYSGVLVVTQTQFDNEEIGFEDYDPPLAGVMSIESGEILFNPAFVETHYGSTLWYSPLDFSEANDGLIGALTDSLFISPPPPPQSHPMISVGNRKALDALVVKNEAQLASLSLLEGQVGVALSTGKLKLSDADLAKATVGDNSFDKLFATSKVYYNGIALNKAPLPLKYPVLLKNDAGDEIVNLRKNTSLRVPPSKMASDGYLTSGYLAQPDKTGVKPNGSATPSFRPNGSGLVASPQEAGDFAIYTSSSCLERLVKVDRASDLPARKDIKDSSAYVSCEANAVGLPVHAPKKWQKDNQGESVYFRQGEVIPSRYVGGRTLVSKRRDAFNLREGDRVQFFKDGVYRPWVYVGGDIASSLNTFLGAEVSVSLINRHLVFEVEVGTTLEISPYTDTGVYNISGIVALGLPTYYHSEHTWSIESGVTLGVYRSPVNLDLSRDITDFKTTSKVDDALIGSVSNAFHFLDHSPLEDGFGYLYGVFFKVDNGVSQKVLYPFTDIAYNFGDKQFKWVEQVSKSVLVQRASTSIFLGDYQILEDSTKPEYEGQISYSDGVNGFETLTLNQDYVINEAQGQVTLIESLNDTLREGVVSIDSFGNLTGDIFSGVVVSQLLKLNRSAGEVYARVTEVVSDQVVKTNLTSAEDNVLCSVLNYRTDKKDILVEALYEPFNHLSDSALVVRKLTPITSAKVVSPFEAISLNRTFYLRVGDTDTDVQVLNKGVLLGKASASLLMPSLNTYKEENGDIYLVIANEVYNAESNNLVRVEAFTNTADIIEYLPTGEINIGESLLNTLSDHMVYYYEVFSIGDTSTLELDPHTGEVKAEVGTYFVEELIEGTDYFANALAGSFQLARPLIEKQEIEVTYQAGDTEGALVSEEKITKKLPFYIRGEVATRKNEHVYTYNSANQTLDDSFTPVIYVDVNLENYDGEETATIGSQKITFKRAISSDRAVKVTYAVFSAQGGELTFTLGTPYYQPPFFLEVGQTSFTLEGDRSEVSIGKLLRLGATCLYITSNTYDQDTNITTIEISPSPTKELGSRSPNNPELMLITDRAVTDFVVPFAEAFGLSDSPLFAPVSRGAKSLALFGNFLEYAIAGNILEIGGDPFTIASATTSEDGNQTLIELTDIVQKGYTSADGLGISKTPIYEKKTPLVVGRGALLTSKPYELMLLNEQGVGYTLQKDVDYIINTATGDAFFDYNHFTGFDANAQLVGILSLIKTPAPYFRDGVLINPQLSASYTRVVNPQSLQNFGLRATYEYADPDGFYFKASSLQEHAQKVIREEYLKNITTFGSYTTSAPDKNNDKGTAGVLATRNQIKNKERVARSFLSFYHNVICSLEQMIETSEGVFIGDRDGKIRFKIRREDRITETPGFEDLIGGDYTPRILFREAYSAVANSPHTLISTDPLIRPHLTPSVIDGVVFVNALGDNRVSTLERMTSKELRRLSVAQMSYAENDIDDIVLVGTKDQNITINGTLNKYPRGVFKKLGELHPLSRLFPQRTKGYGQIYKGHVSEEYTGHGIFTAGRVVETGDGVFDYGWADTNGDTIGQLQNNILGEISSTSDATLTRRYPRARIVKFSAIGFPELDTLLGLVGAESFTQTPRPAVIATPLLVKEFPLDDDNLPDLTALISGGGALSDLSSGDVNLTTPPFEVGEAVNFGYSDGSVATLRDTAYTLIQGEPEFAQVLVRNIYGGCVVDFKSVESDPITRLQDISNVKETLALEGDTLLGVSTLADTDAGVAPTITELAKVATLAKTYRAGSDFTLRSSGELVDRTLPSVNDSVPLPLKEMLGQTPPYPGLYYDADITFSYGELEPLRLPALFSEDKADSGDYQVPYLSNPSVEKMRLRALQKAFANILDQDNPTTTQSQYPDEIIQRNAVPNDLGAVEFDQFLLPIHVAGAYTPASGIADTEPYDLILSETLEGSSLGSRGILSVGAVSVDEVEPPRFVSHTEVGNKITYTLNNAVVYEDTSHLSGVAVSREFNNTLNVFVYRFKIESIGGLDLTDFQTFWLNAESGTQIDISLYKRDIDPFAVNEGEVVDIIRLIKNTPQGSVGGTVQRLSADGTTSSLFTLVFGSFSFQVNLVILTSIVGTPLIEQNHYNHVVQNATDFYVSNLNNSEGHLDFSVDVSAVSRTANIEEDRLTFSEVYPLSHAGERGLTHSVSGLSLEAQLDVALVETGLTGNPQSSVNSASEINGGTPLTFKRRSSLYLGCGFTLGLRWGLKAHGWEGHGNTPVKDLLESAQETLSLAVIPSSTPIAEGTLLAEDLASTNSELILKDITLSSGSLSAIEKSDVLKIKSSAVANYPCTTKAGTYLIRGVVPADVGFDYGTYTKDEPTPFTYPTLKEVTEEAGVYSLTAVEENINEPSIFRVVNGRVHVITDITRFYSARNSDLQFAVVCADYASLTGSTFNDLSNFRDALGNVMTAQDFMALVNNVRGSFISGMTRLPLDFEYSEDFVPQGYHDPANSIYGVTEVVINSFLIGGSLEYRMGRVVDATGGELGIISGNIGVVTHSDIFAETARKTYEGPYLYNRTPSYLDIDFINDAQWLTLNNPRGVALVNPSESALRCISPLNTFESTFRATAGIYIEPTMPMPTQDLGTNTAQRVVDAQNPNNPASANLKLGMRALLDYVPTAIATEKEYVNFEVSHIRRFHDVNNTIGGDASELAYIYEMRRANSLAFSSNPTNNLKTIFDSTGGTQLGLFTDLRVNVNAGDELRVKRRGVVVFQSRITKVEDERLYLELDWELDNDHSNDEAFIMLKQTPVPHEQSCEELLEAITEKVRVYSKAEAGFGGYTPWRTSYADSVNILKDNNTERDILDPLYLSYVNEGVAVGDLVIIDPCGQLNNLGEYGARPFGDVGVEGRLDGLNNPVFQAGAPSPFDDNRGFYIVTEVTTNEIKVSSLTGIVGNFSSNDVIEDSDDNKRAFAVYPTINGSPLTDDGREGQMDLRPTEYANPNTLSFGGNNLSIAPYSYTIIKPTGLISLTAIGQILLIRERTLSMIEQIRALYSNKKYGTYRDFQVESHAQDVGSNIDPTRGLGVALNVLITDLRGKVEIAPYVNDADSLSILDRRVFIEDTDLDTETPRGSVVPYTLYDDDFNQPTLQTRIGELLNQGEQLLESRYAWLDYRVNRKDGSFQELLRYDVFELPRRQKEAITRARRIVNNLEG